MPNDPRNPSLSPAAALNRVFEESIEYLDAPPSAVTVANLASSGRIFETRTKKKEWEVRHGKPSAEGIGIYEPSNLQNNSTVSQAALSIATKRIAHRFAVSRVEAGEAAAKGVGALRDLLGEHFQEALDSIVTKLNFAIQQDDPTTEVVSLSTVLDNSQAYAGIDPVAVPKWRATVNSAGAPRPFNRDLLIDFDAQTRTAGRNYDKVWMHPNTEVRYKKLFVDAAGTNSLPNYTNLGQLKAVELGIGDSTYNGKTIVLEPDMPENQIRFTRMANLELFFFNMPLADPRAGMPRAIDEVVNNSLGFPVRICSYPMSVPTILEFEFYTVAQLRVRNRQNAMAITNLTTTPWTV
jgi:hypothetical protein